MAIVHSYLRFSDPSQAAGDSLRRQNDLAVSWCKKHGHTLSDLRFHDLGKSGWKAGKQKALDSFLKAVDDGRVEPGEILLVEAIDRLSRKGIQTTRMLVDRILSRGISIAILSPVEKIYLSDDAEQDIGAAIELAAFAFSANAYSENLSRRVKAAGDSHRRKFKAGDVKRWSPVAPAWLEWDDAKQKWRTKPETVKAIKHVFKRTIEGVGRVRLCQEMNEKFTPPGGRKSSTSWNGQYIARLIQTRAVLGELKSTTGEILRAYYPPIITEEEWRAANVSNASRRSQRGPEKQHANIFAGILYHARDRAKMGFYSISRSKTKRNGDRIINRRYISWSRSTGKPGACPASIDVGRFESLIFTLLPKVELSPGKSENTILEAERQYLQTEIDSVQQQITSRAGSAVTLGPVLTDLARQLEEVETKIRECGSVAVQPTIAFRRKLAAMRRGTQQERERLRDAVHAIVRRIEVLPIKLGTKRSDRVRCLIEIEFRNGEFARGLELPDDNIVVTRGPVQTMRLSEQLVGGWDFTAKDYGKAVKLLG